MKRLIVTLITFFKSRLAVKIGDMVLFFDTRSRIAKSWFYPRYWRGNPHEPPISRLFVDEIGKAYTVLDIGANQGFFTVLSAKLLNSEGSVHAFELDPVLLPLIQRSLTLNDYKCPVNLFCGAVAATEGEFVDFAPHIEGNLTTNSILRKNESGTKVVVQTVSIDSYCRKLEVSPDFIKVDVEGAEKYAVEGMRETIRANKPKLLLEVHPKQLRERGMEPASIPAEIVELVPEYSVYIIDDHRVSSEGARPLDSVKSVEFGERPVVFFFKVE